jgi:hypothetical protein
MSSSSDFTSAVAARDAKRSIAEAMDDAFALASPDQMHVFQEMANLDLNQITTGWTSAACRTNGSLEMVDLAQVVAGEIFMAPSSRSIDGEYPMEVLANGGWSFFVVEQDLSRDNQGILIKIVGTSDPFADLFPGWGDW